MEFYSGFFVADAGAKAVTENKHIKPISEVQLGKSLTLLGFGSWNALESSNYIKY